MIPIRLPRTGDSLRHRKTEVHRLLDLSHLLRKAGPWAYQAHVTAYYIDQLRELIEKSASQNPADGSDPRIVRGLEQRPMRLVEGTETLLHGVRSVDHRSELEQGEFLPIFPNPSLPVEDGAATGHLDRRDDDQPERTQRGQQNGGNQEVQQSLDPVLIPSLDGTGEGSPPVVLESRFHRTALHLDHVLLSVTGKPTLRA